MRTLSPSTLAVTAARPARARGIRARMADPRCLAETASSYNDLSDAAIHHEVHPRAAPGEPSARPLFSFGVISDVQYADIPDGHSAKGVPRFYRNSLTALAAAVDSWRDAGVHFCMHLGDIIDGFNPKDQSEASLTRVLDIFDRLGKPHYHMLGNNCLYNLPRPRLNERLNIPPSPGGGSHYSFSPHPTWRIVVLDAYALSVLGWPEGDPRVTLAKSLILANNPNARAGRLNDPEGLEGPQRRFVAFNGGLGEEQLGWLDAQLGEARSAGQRVILACHLPMQPGSCYPTCLLWDYEACLAVVERHGDTVALTLAGHMHRDGDCVGANGTHHRCIYGVVEAQPGKEFHARVDVFGDRLEIIGFGEVGSQTVPLSGAVKEVAQATAG